MAKYHGDSADTFNGATVASNAPDPALPSKPNEGHSASCHVTMPVKGKNTHDTNPGNHVVSPSTQNKPHGTSGGGQKYNSVSH